MNPARAQFAWCSLDWANSAFPTVIITFVFAAYFAKAVAADAIAGTAAWSYTISLSMAAVALTGPLLGAIADAGGRRKPWVLGFSLVCIGATALLWFAVPQSSIVIVVLAVVAIANYGFETSIIFYNAMLPDVAPPERIGRISGWGWALGYCGGLACLVLCLLLLVQPDPPLFGLDRAEAEPVRATALFVAGWYLIFLIPFLVLVPDRAATGIGATAAARQGLKTLVSTVRHLRRYRQVGLYLLAHMIYTDGLNTLFGIGGIYAAVTFGMDFNEILVFGIALNVAAGAGAFAFGWVDDWIGPKRTLIIALVAMIAIGAGLIVVADVTWFWVLALALSLFFGPAQSASRTLMARLAPPKLEAEMFGLYALSGKATAFLGPALFGWVTQLAGNQRAGLATILVLFIAGLGLLVPVREPDLAANGGSGASA